MTKKGASGPNALREYAAREALALLAKGPATRAQLAQATGLSRSTFAALLRDLINDGVITVSAPSSEGGRGRPRGLVSLGLAAGLVVGAALSEPEVRVAMADLSGTVVAEVSSPATQWNSAPAVLKAAADVMERLFRTQHVTPNDVHAIVVGVPSPVDPRTGRVGHPALPGWAGSNPEDYLSGRLGRRVRVENNANLMAVGEQAYGCGRPVQDLIFVSIGRGIGAGLVIDGHPYRGFAGMAGELGHLQSDPGGRVCLCGNRGCLVASAGGSALIELLGHIHPECSTFADVGRLVEEKDPAALRVVTDVGRSIGRQLGHVVTLLNPEVVVLGGVLASEAMLSGARESIHRYALSPIVEGMEFRLSALQERAELLGAVRLAISSVNMSTVAAEVGA